MGLFSRLHQNQRQVFSKIFPKKLITNFFLTKEEKEHLERSRRDYDTIIELFSNKDNWCRKAMARDKEGEQLICPNDENAIAWCLLGAFYAIDASQESILLLHKILYIEGLPEAHIFNDNYGYKCVLDFLKFIRDNVLNSKTIRYIERD